MCEYQLAYMVFVCVRFVRANVCTNVYHVANQARRGGTTLATAGKVGCMGGPFRGRRFRDR